MNLSIDRRLVRVVTIGALTAMLGLTGCGRKGPLEPPPSASLTEPAETPRQGPGGATLNPMAPAAKQTTESFGPDGQPIAPKGPRKSIFLDWLLN